ncbi:glycosyltransferase family 2 protein, partial [Candidatus Berkelbacteria bacterium]|nr:glycosyltransferase family 2 protein [Candidatus Berkelbacteria bacterium]
MPYISIIILNWNGLDESQRCLKALFESNYPVKSWEVFLVDNGSEEKEGRILKKQFPAIRLMESQNNLGFAGGNNLALAALLKEGKADFALTLNNDTVVDSNFLRELAVLAENDSQIGAVASKMLFYDQPKTIENVGHNLLVSGDIVPRGRGEAESLYASVVEVMGACAGAAFWRVKMLRQIGLFREEFFANYEDADLSLRGIVA